MSKWIKHSTEERDGFIGSFHMAIWPFLVIGQMFGVMPIVGVKNRSFAALHFKWKTLRTFYSLTVALMLSSYSVFLLWKILTVSVEFELIGLFEFDSYISFVELKFNNWRLLFMKWIFSANLLYYSINTCEFISFFVLTFDWPNLMQRWQIVESDLSTLCSRKDKDKYLFKIRLITMIVLSAALGIFTNRNEFGMNLKKIFEISLQLNMP